MWVLNRVDQNEMDNFNSTANFVVDIAVFGAQCGRWGIKITHRTLLGHLTKTVRWGNFSYQPHVLQASALSTQMCDGEFEFPIALWVASSPTSMRW
jgi:hypothetical protein